MRRIATLLLAALVGCLSLLVPATVAQAEGREASLVDGFRACIAGGGTADLLLLVDESSSLQLSDPGNARVESAGYLLKQLAGYADEAPNKPNVAIGTFASGYSDLHDWTALDSNSLPAVQESLESLKTKVDGLETDYWSALDGARARLAERAKATGDERSCQALIWFSDGDIDYEVRDTDEAKKAYGTEKAFAPGVDLTSEAGVDKVRKAATQDICRPGGVADQLRSSDVALFAIGLQGSTAKPGDFSFMQSVATGKDGKDKCGKLLSPVPGEFHLATDIDSLLFAFDGMSSVGGAPIVQEKGICQKEQCTEEAHTFVLDQSTPEVTVLASADAPALTATVISPSGKKVELSRSAIGKETSTRLGANTVAHTWLSEETYSMSLTAGKGNKDWSGPWRLVFTDPVGKSADKTSKTSVRIIGSLRPALLDGKDRQWRVGETLAGVKLGLVDGSGKAVDPGALLGKAAFTAKLTGAQGKELVLLQDAGKKDMSKPLDVDLAGFPVGAAELAMELSITTASSTSGGKTTPGTVLEPERVTVPLMLLAPSEFPVLPPKIDFGKAEGKPELTTSIPLSGSGCVWLEGSEPEIVASPEGMGRISIASPGSSAESCAPAGSGSMDLTLAAENAGNGAINGVATLMIAPDGEPGKAMPVQVDFTASVARPLNTTNFLLALAVALLLGPGIPLLFLYGAKRLISKIPGQPLSSEVIALSVEHGQVLRDGKAFELRPTDLTNLISIDPGGTRTLELAPYTFKARTGFSPVGPGYVAVVAPGQSGASSAHPSTDKNGTEARLPLAIHNHWIVFTAPGMGRQAASVLILASGESSQEEKRKLQEDINRRLPDLLERLNERTGQDDGAVPAGSTFGDLGREDAPVGAFQGFGEVSHPAGGQAQPFGQAPSFGPPPGAPAPPPADFGTPQPPPPGTSSGSLFGWGEADPPPGPRP